jgi:histidine triad (HIT) family protein
MTSPKMPCVFCAIVAGKRKTHCIYENSLSMAILDINPLAEGHCLVIPKRHVQWWFQMTEAEIQSSFLAAKIVAEKIMKTYKPDFVAQYIRGRRIPHTHIFLVPTYKNDPVDRFFNALEGFQESPSALVRLKKSDSLRCAARRLIKA